MVRATDQLQALLSHPAVRTFLLLQVFDLLTTLIGLSLGAVERNHLALWFVGQFGTATGLLLLKSAAAALILALFVRANTRFAKEPLHWLCLHGANVFYMMVIYNNLGVLGVVA